ncbi:hypothetical protein MMPV_006826 [Pyropia vietnamensis]
MASKRRVGVGVTLAAAAALSTAAGVWRLAGLSSLRRGAPAEGHPSHPLLEMRWVTAVSRLPPRPHWTDRPAGGRAREEEQGRDVAPLPLPPPPPLSPAAVGATRDVASGPSSAPPLAASSHCARWAGAAVAAAARAPRVVAATAAEAAGRLGSAVTTAATVALGGMATLWVVAVATVDATVDAAATIAAAVPSRADLKAAWVAAPGLVRLQLVLEAGLVLAVAATVVVAYVGGGSERRLTPAVALVSWDQPPREVASSSAAAAVALTSVAVSPSVEIV